ncbi:MAG: PD40 domain-containing protein [Gemmatimonadetes bacterium]|nr:PD40 domain-containing protein [Gemmatimonadota bacterium]
MRLLVLRTTPFLAAAALWVVTPVPAAAQDTPAATDNASAPRPMTVDDALDMVSVGSPLISPDGSWVLYSKRTLDWDENEYTTEYWRVSADGEDRYEFIGEDGGSGFQFSPQGTYLSFRRPVGEGPSRAQQIFVMRMTGGEAYQLTEHDVSIAAYEWADDESRLYFQADDEKPDTIAAEERKGADAIFVDEGPNGQQADQWQNLWVFDLESEESRQITDEEFLIGSWDVAPDGEQIALTARYQNRRNDAYLNEIYLADVDDGELRRITENGAPEGGVSWAPDGSTILFTAADDEEWMNRNTKLWLLDPESGEHRLISGAFEGSPGNPTWTEDSQRILFSGQQGTDTNVFALDVASGAIEQVTDVEGTLSPGSFSKDRTRYAYTFTDYRTPGDVWLGHVDGSDPVRLTDANPQVS